MKILASPVAWDPDYSKVTVYSLLPTPEVTELGPEGWDLWDQAVRAQDTINRSVPTLPDHWALL